MARVIIEDCLSKVSSHFDLVLVATERAKQISSGRKTASVKKGIKSHVTSLREIGDGVISVDVLHADLLKRLKANPDDYDKDEDQLDDNIIEEIQTTMELIPGDVESISITDTDHIFSEENSSEDALLSTEDDTLTKKS